MHTYTVLHSTHTTIKRFLYTREMDSELQASTHSDGLLGFDANASGEREYRLTVTRNMLQLPVSNWHFLLITQTILIFTVYDINF